MIIVIIELLNNLTNHYLPSGRKFWYLPPFLPFFLCRPFPFFPLPLCFILFLFFFCPKEDKEKSKISPQVFPLSSTRNGLLIIRNAFFFVFFFSSYPLLTLQSLYAVLKDKSRPRHQKSSLISCTSY